MRTKTREEWLNEGVVALRRTFTEAGYTIPAKVRVSCSWPGGGSARKRFGECWASRASAENYSEIFISPVIADPVEALDILAHELCHAVDDCAHGHKAPFVKIARAIGLEGKPTATVSGPELRRKLTTIAVDLGDYPHAAMSLGGHKKQTTRMIKIECQDCSGVFRTTQKWIDDADHLSCPFCRSDDVVVG